MPCRAAAACKQAPTHRRRRSDDDHMHCADSRRRLRARPHLFGIDMSVAIGRLPRLLRHRLFGILPRAAAVAMQNLHLSLSPVPFHYTDSRRRLRARPHLFGIDISVVVGRLARTRHRLFGNLPHQTSSVRLRRRRWFNVSRHLLERRHRVEDVGIALWPPLPAMPAPLLGRHAKLKTG